MTWAGILFAILIYEYTESLGFATIYSFIASVGMYILAWGVIKTVTYYVEE